MQQITSLQMATDILTERALRAPRNQVYTLDRMRQLLQHLGDPQETIPVVHIAGTSGKTSTAYYTAALLQAAGRQVGLTVSPHVVAISDRVQINGAPLAEEEFCAKLTRYLEIVDASKLQPTYFELMIAFAFWVFAAKKVDTMVIEVGVGGLLDSTNVIRRSDKVCIITDIGLDHMSTLGNSLPEIAKQKAGIIQPQNAVFMHQQSTEIMTVIEMVAKRNSADLYVETRDRYDVPLSLFQRRNCNLAVAAVDYILARDGQSLDADMVSQAATTIIPGRMEELMINGRPIIIDGAHNPQKLQALRDTIRARYPHKKVTVLAAFVDHADVVERMIGGFQELALLRPHIIATSFSGSEDWPHHGAPAETVAAAAKAAAIHPVEVVSDPHAAYTALLESSADVLVVTGSFYLLNHIRMQALKDSAKDA